MLLLTLLSTDTAPPVIVAAVVTYTVALPLSILPPTESVTRMLKPETTAELMGFLKLVTEKAISVLPEIFAPKAPVTVSTEFENAQERVDVKTATVVQEILP
jgi:hypothetical protein